MRTTTKRAPEFYEGPADAARARMPLAQPGTFAVLDAEDMQSLVAAGVSTSWFINKHGYVAVNVPRVGPMPVARLVMGAGDGERVSYADDDKTNLLRANLRISRKHSCRLNLPALLELQAERRKAREAASAAARLKTAPQRQAAIWDALQKDQNA